LNKKCWICGATIPESRKFNTDVFYLKVKGVTVNRPYAYDATWYGYFYVCQKCAKKRIGVDHTGQNTNKGSK
jgi:hypothetical protein